MAKQQPDPKKTNGRITKEFPLGRIPAPQTKKTIDSLGKLGYKGDPSTVSRKGNKTSITFVKKKN